jgi:hypothetical protein
MTFNEKAHWDRLRQTISEQSGEHWEHNGISGLCRNGDRKNEAPLQIGKYSGTLVVVGTAPCVYDDLQLVPDNCDRMAVGNIGSKLDNLTHWVSIHSECLVLLAEMRVIENYFHGNIPILHGHHYRRQTNESLAKKHHITYWCTLPKVMGGGPFACQIAVAMGYERIICTGMPSDDRGSFLGSYTLKTFTPEYVEEKQDAWRRCAEIPEFKKRVRSVSGFTKELFGAP